MGPGSARHRTISPCRLPLSMNATLLSYGVLLVWSFLAATLLPVGSEPALIAIVRKENAFLLPVAVATLGNFMGACTTYFIGRGAARLADQKLNTHSLDDTRAGRLFRRFGQPVLLLSWVPVVGDAVVALAGALRVPLLPFSLWVIVGKLARYAVVAWIALQI